MRKKRKDSKVQQDLRIPTTPEALTRAVLRPRKAVEGKASTSQAQKERTRKVG